MTERLAGGDRKYIRRLKPEARTASSELEAWRIVDEILSTRVEDYPEKFIGHLSVIRGFHQLRWDHRFSQQNLLRDALNNFMVDNSLDVLDQLKPVFGVIAQVYSKP